MTLISKASNVETYALLQDLRAVLATWVFNARTRAATWPLMCRNLKNTYLFYSFLLLLLLFAMALSVISNAVNFVGFTSQASQRRKQQTWYWMTTIGTKCAWNVISELWASQSTITLLVSYSLIRKCTFRTIISVSTPFCFDDGGDVWRVFTWFARQPYWCLNPMLWDLNSFLM